MGRVSMLLEQWGRVSTTDGYVPIVFDGAVTA